MSKQAIPDSKRADLFKVEPERLRLVTDKSHVLYDPRVELPPDEALIASIRASGVLEPIAVRKDGTEFEVVFGRRRTKAAVELNRRSSKSEQILVPVFVWKGTDAEAYQAQLAENCVRQDDLPSVVVAKLSRGLRFGCTETDLAVAAGCTPDTIRNRLKLLDADKAVIAAVDAGTIGETQARKLTALPREQQRKVLDEMVSSGATKGAPARKKVEKALNGRNDKETGARKLTRVETLRWLDELAQHKGEHAHLFVMAARVMLGDREACSGKYRSYLPSFFSDAE
jgi:ParB family chromosome partitioning protein